MAGAATHAREAGTRTDVELRDRTLRAPDHSSDARRPRHRRPRGIVLARAATRRVDRRTPADDEWPRTPTHLVCTGGRERGGGVHRAGTTHGHRCALSRGAAMRAIRIHEQGGPEMLRLE